MKHVVMGITGASGAPYARRLAQALARPDVHLHLVASEPGRVVLADELDVVKLTVESLLERPAPHATLYSDRDVGARIASGSFLTTGMVVCPCSAHTLSAIACGLAETLITRAAMVTLKEGRRLVLVLRETPLSTIELQNMLRLARAGVVILPASPGFYLRPRTIEDLLDFVVGRVLDQLGLEHALNTRWDPLPADASGTPRRREEGR